MRILVLVHPSLVPPDTMAGRTEREVAAWKTEFDVVETLREQGHDVVPAGVADAADLDLALTRVRPRVAWNLLEDFEGGPEGVPRALRRLARRGVPCTGCGASDLSGARDKARARRRLAAAGVPVARGTVVPVGRAARRPAALGFPLLVKPRHGQGSLGIARASVVANDRELARRVEFVHRRFDDDALVEEYVDGREIYVGTIGRARVRTGSAVELSVPGLAADAPRIATGRLKWDPSLQLRLGAELAIPGDLPSGLLRLAARAHRALGLSGYARTDLRLDASGRAVVLESNPNPDLAWGSGFAESFAAAGVSYEGLLGRILRLGLSRPGGPGT